MTEPLMLRSSNRRLDVQLEEASEPFVVRYPRKSRDTGRRITLPGFGTSRVTEQTREPNRHAVSFNGRKLPWSMTVELTADSLKRQVRRLRPQEGIGIAELDAQIEAAANALRAARLARKAALVEAFRRGHVVTVKELVEAAEAVEAARS